MSAYIRAAGWVSALGPDWRHACAAARAGLRRASALETFELPSADDGEPVPVAGHAAGLVTRGFSGPGRLVRLLAAALSDLARSPATAEALANARTGLFVVLPEADRTASLLDLVDDADRRAFLAERPVIHDDDVVKPLAAETLVARALSAAGWGFAPGDLRIVHGDAAAFATTLNDALEVLGRMDLDNVIVAAADSLLDEETLAWLDATGRLKSETMPAGLEAGEAAGAVLVSLDPTGALAVLRGVEFGEEPRPLASGEPSSGEGLATLLEKMAARGWAQEGAPWLVTDMNGEGYGANDLALAMVRVRARIPSVAMATVGYPVASFGDTGAARMLGCCCTVLAAFERRYAPASGALVVGAGSDRARAGILLGAPV